MSGYAALTTTYVAIKFGDASTRLNSLPEGEGVINYPRLLRSQSANAVHSQRSMVPVRQHR